MLKATETTAGWAAFIGGAALLLVSLLVSVEVILRKFANLTLGGADEISGYVFAISTSWALSYTLFNRGHIRIDVLYNYFGDQGKALLDVVSLLSLGLMGAFVSWYGFGVLERSHALASKANTPLATPLWLPQLFWAMGLALFLWSICLLVVLAVRATLRGDTRTVKKLAGIPSIDEDVHAALDETASAGTR